ncbi:DctP family TRAP transporter solute-binding subunit [Stappia stellulata]|uniref:DctP family TRAP transporter solute-binding subunit n=1 Tax=Stappia stellulata TaxID=71235 RepID=UPI00041E26B3|nr:DctP family TRAP transporter solute-binding subunit [Stappia stellulata]
MKSLAGAIVTAACFAFAAPAIAEECQSGETVIKFSHVVSASGHPKGDAAAHLARRVNAEMDGKACMQVFANSELFDDDQVMEALLLGDVHLAAPSLSKFEPYTLKFRLFDLPFLFQDLAAVDRFTASSAGQELLSVMTDVGFLGLGYWTSGLKQFSANKPLLLPSDAKGLTFRVQTSSVAMAMIEALGATGRQLAFKDVYGALESGDVDGQENTWSNIYTQKFYEVQDGVTATNHQLLAYLVVTSAEWLKSLDPDVRDQLLQIVREVSARSNAAVARKEAENRQRLLEAGAEIRVLTADQREVWIGAMKPVWEMFEEVVGADLIEAAQAANSAD